MYLTKDKRRDFWHELSELKVDVNLLKELFQGEMDIGIKEYAQWNQDLARVFKRLQGLQRDFGVEFTKGDK